MTTQHTPEPWELCEAFDAAEAARAALEKVRGEA